MRLPLLFVGALVGGGCGPECPPTQERLWYHDVDGDGFGDADSWERACVAVKGTVESYTDCDDGAASVYPGAPEVWYDGIDQDCAGDDDFDQDGDGFVRDEECDDLDPARVPDPEVPEVWYDGVDQDCDGNDGDQDGDGHYLSDYAFEIPPAYLPGDCADDPAVAVAATNAYPDVPAAEVYPGADDIPYDGVDANCDGVDDFDADGDGYHSDRVADWTGVFGDDCDDADPATYPGAKEVWYDGVDQSCDGNDDDQDEDGVSLPEGDCDDTDPDTRPGAWELCGDTVDQDCDGGLNGDRMRDCVDWFVDADGDGFGVESDCACEPYAPYVASVGDDCDDADRYAYPGATELCDGQRNDCDDGSWNTNDEDGTVSLEDASDAWTDLRAVWSGTAEAPVVYTLPDSGTVWVCQGEWFVTIEGPPDPGSAQLFGRQNYGADIHAGGAGRGLTVEGAGVSVEVDSIRFTGGEATHGGGVYVADATVSLVDVELDGNSAELGGGLYVSGGTVLLDQSLIYGNTASEAGGGLYFEETDVTISDTDINENLVTASGAVRGGGIAFVSTGAASLVTTSLVFTENVVESTADQAFGGAMALDLSGTGSVRFEASRVEYNEARGVRGAYGGGVSAFLSGGAGLSTNSLSSYRNLAEGEDEARGGVLYLDHRSTSRVDLAGARLEFSSVVSDSAVGGGAYVYLTAGSDLVLTDGSVSYNETLMADGVTVDGQGGGLRVSSSGGSIELTQTDVEYNESGEGGGIYFYGWSGARLTATGGEVAGNDSGGMVYYSTDATTSLILADVDVNGNDDYGLYTIAASGDIATTECSGSSSTVGGFYDNSGYGIAGLCASVGGTCTFVSRGCDFGEDGASSDNRYSDVYIDGVTGGEWGDDASFGCTNSTCL